VTYAIFPASVLSSCVESFRFVRPKRLQLAHRSGLPVIDEAAFAYGRRRIHCVTSKSEWKISIRTSVEHV
jgi:hypothetical protein